MKLAVVVDVNGTDNSIHDKEFEIILGGNHGESRLELMPYVVDDPVDIAFREVVHHQDPACMALEILKRVFLCRQSLLLCFLRRPLFDDRLYYLFFLRGRYLCSRFGFESGIGGVCGRIGSIGLALEAPDVLLFLNCFL